MSEFERIHPRDRAGRFTEASHERAQLQLPPFPVRFDPEFEAILESAAKLQSVVPDAVLVGGTASAYYASHRLSFDHDHVIADLKSRYAQVLDAVESTDGWATSPRASKSPMTIMGALDGTQAGLRNLRRSVPLEVEVVTLPSGAELRIPTRAEQLRIKGFLIVQRNAVRDYLDVAAVGALDMDEAANALAGIDDYYREHTETHGSVATALAERLAEPEPKDRATLRHLPAYKGLAPYWQDWHHVVETCQDLSERMPR